MDSAPPEFQAALSVVRSSRSLGGGIDQVDVLDSASSKAQAALDDPQELAALLQQTGVT